MTPRILALTIAVCAATLASAPRGAAEEERDYVSFLDELVDLDRLCRVEEGVISGQASSYDRRSRYDAATDQYVDWDANGDAGNYIRTDEATGEGVMAELEGPGCIHRIWSANPQGKIRFYLDGDTQPTYEFDFNELFSGNIEPFRRPLVWQRRVVLGGDNPASDCYLPIPFMKSCKVTADEPHRQYYHIGYSLYRNGARVRSFRLPLTEDETKVLEEVCAKLENPGWDPATRPMHYEKRSMELRPGKKMTLTLGGGPAMIRELRAKVTGDEPDLGRKVTLKAYWDRERAPSIWAPIGDFFGEGFAAGHYGSLPMGVTGGTAYSFWRMPYRQRARFVVESEADSPALVYLKVGYEPLSEWSDDLAHFQAKWRREKHSATFDYPFLECGGRGRFVGVALFIDNLHGGWWGEGDEKIYVDGEKFPSYFGTGSEDYFGDAWGIRNFHNPYHGCVDAPERQQSCYRWHITDSIPFQREFRITIENYAARDDVHNDYASMAYWYQLPPREDFFRPVSVDERLPQTGPPPPGLVEAESLFAGGELPAGLSVVRARKGERELSGGKALCLRGKPGDSFDVPLKAPRPGIYTLRVNAMVLRGSPRFRVLQDGEPIGRRVRFGEAGETFRIALAESGEGRTRRELLIDSFQLESSREFIKEWMVIGPWDNPENQGLTTPQPPEETIDSTLEYPGKDGRTVAWKRAAVGETGAVNLHGLLEPNQNGVAYAYVNVVAPEPVKTTLFVGSDDGVRAWLNGKLVIDHRVDRGLAPDQDSADVELKEGKNSLLLKIDQGAGDWGFCARFWDPSGAFRYNLEAP